MIGTILNRRYELLQEVDQGPVFTTYGAKDRMNSKDVTIRVISQDIGREPEFISALQSVVSTTSSLSHQGLEKVIGLEQDHGVSYVLSESLTGSTLEDRIKRLSSLSVPVSLQIAIEICEVLEALHEAGVVHGDISAKTIVSTATDSAKVTSVGFWQAYAHSTKAAIGVLRDMSPYLAPEVTSGSMPSAASDIYSVGVLLWQLLTGRLPYPGDTPVAIATKHASHPYPSLRNITNSVPQALDELVRKTMEKDPRDRYGTVSALLTDLRLLLDALRFGRPLTWPLRPETSAQPRAVAPELNVARPQSKSDQKKKRSNQRRETDGLPRWFMFLVWCSLITAVLLVGGWLAFNSSRPKPLIVPNLTGKSVSQANEDLAKMGARGRIARREINERFGDGIIISTSPAAGEEFLPSSRIEYVVSMGSRFVVVPDLRGKSKEEARKLLASLGLDISDQLDYRPSSDGASDIVLSQVPASGRRVERSARVRLTLSSGERDPNAPSPLDRRFLYTLKITIPRERTGNVRMRVELQDTRGREIVYDASNRPGQVVTLRVEAAGPDAMFTIFWDNVMVKQITESAEGVAP
ncbi:MAG: PASTA domain-containing protein [Fimbriimonadaceae bacterium]|jgi:serine/threonine-protein kinase|nr:PASTA domain-containing protein [Fimbriimonadaceae bacterium]